MASLPPVAIIVGRTPLDRYSVNRGYIDGVLAAGGRPIIVPAGPGVPPELALEALDDVRAVVLTGGGDVAPERYGAPEHAKAMELDTDRDLVELAMTRAAVDRGLPVLGICRGIQLLAVAMGGALVADLPDAGFDGHWQEELQYEPVHEVEAEAGSQVQQALGGTTFVNSIHHQAVADPGSLRATAVSTDGVIEALEGDGILGVQWHPERLLGTDPRHVAPFRWLVSV